MVDNRIYRIIDANINRAREGLRVIEESFRFVFEKKEIADKLRSIRHEISRIPLLLRTPFTCLLSSRESQKDVGSKRKEKKRSNLQEIISSNFSRVEESVRVLEEYSRLLNPKATPKIKKIRFDLYDLQKYIQLSLYRKNLASRLGLYIITDKKIAGKSNEQIVKEALKGGADTIQLRDKDLSYKKLLVEAKKIRKIIPENKAIFIVNDNVDVALCSGADGVHLGKDDMPVKEARKILGEDKIIGVSCDNIREAEKAEKDGADYISLGPVFPTDTKKDVPSPLGVKVIKEAKRKISIPIVAIGGINESNIRSVLNAGADSVAVISAVLKSDNINLKTASIKTTFSKLLKM
ncbi:MAG: thiamine phosphate synthase [Candidatus Ratteibacteria bacterium]|nr:thiamine phosphate synthase [Candidatus Ratteibacteria bacterium]